MKTKVVAIALTLIGSLALSAAPGQTVGDDVKDASKKTTKVVKKGAVKTKDGVKKGTSKAASATEKGAKSVKNKTTDTSN